jgi:dTDP-4-dehydrorhamnose 3,5-epimerase
MSHAHGGAHLSIPYCEPGVGKSILSPNSGDLIEGVAFGPLESWADESGFRVDMVRGSSESSAAAAISGTLSRPGAIRAFHFRRRHARRWMLAAGALQVGIVDLRLDSPTFGVKNTLYAGTCGPMHVRIPQGVAHGYKVIGDRPAMLFEILTESADRGDMGQIPYDDISIAYEWESSLTSAHS